MNKYLRKRDFELNISLGRLHDPLALDCVAPVIAVSILHASIFLELVKGQDFFFDEFCVEDQFFDFLRIFFLAVFSESVGQGLCELGLALVPIPPQPEHSFVQIKHSHSKNKLTYSLCRRKSSI